MSHVTTRIEGESQIDVRIDYDEYVPVTIEFDGTDNAPYLAHTVVVDLSMRKARELFHELARVLCVEVRS